MSIGLGTPTVAYLPPANTSFDTTHDTGTSDAIPPMPGLARQDTNSSTGSALRPPNGNWAFEISGVCPSCHHYHKSLRVHVRISNDSTQVRDVYCKKCKRLLLSSGNANATRLSLLSTMSLEPDPIETEFRTTLIHMIRASTPIAVLSPVLTVIPEVKSAGPSRETSIRSRSGRSSRMPTTTFDDNPLQKTVHSIGGYKHNKNPLAEGRHILSDIKKKVRARFFKSRNIPFNLDKWFSRKESSKYEGHHQDLACAPISASPPIEIAPSSREEHAESPEDIDTNFDLAALDIFTSSTTAADALASLKTLDPQALRALPPQKRISWGRKQLTEFKTRFSGVTAHVGPPGMNDTDGITEPGEYLHWLDGHSPRRHSILAFMGGGFPSYEDNDFRRASDHTLNGRPLSMSETHLSEADTLVDDHRRSLPARPLSIDNVVHDWSQIQRNRAEARRSIDSTATGGAVRSIAARSHAYNRLSRNSLNHASSFYGTEPTTSRDQLQIGEEAERAGARASTSQRPRSLSPSPPKVETDTMSQHE
ncbi:hypothetical protein COCC4DRAFT_176626 [Bipolaris maydis ATCC 48331]|uniref:Uncharacterized protein n=2 Tax=Cochliobolus heterostrophus TaxID=5016 RepID=M2V433_COCH5|nr:uncharacterized protein COCC4DRAFT_176626 [Bipolaris maydis ATCC 48331]EMD94768.1 hypothetical protein COCHEDRAFT_1128548 [Bipolaris maydis C5]KAJ5029186.1 hypothetical protein J3E73DRAFT_226693 [Bipolaris maydis]ENI01521.1 hypothetical protein COCC4DRAFT_176626 [Bipolaris maydis ATCC 48331]KAJ5062080.1 hypothetical protein J3E74DRAFT_268242 [Bipolaris maydis]KAJ6192583.1 hypothetical protein J3E72DRAFT_253295 [Bipolaris maydis]